MQRKTKRIQMEKRSLRGDEEKEKTVCGGEAGESFVFPLLPYCMTQENLTVIIMEG